MKKLLAVSDPTGGQDQQSAWDDPTPTQRVYRPIATLDAEHRAAFTEMQGALTRGDQEGMKAAFDRIMLIQAEQEIAHRAAREYIHAKIQREMELSNGR